MRWSQLPKEYQDLANDFPIKAGFNLHKEGEYGFDRILSIFYWGETPQGWEFWNQCDESESIDQLPGIPTIK